MVEAKKPPPLQPPDGVLWRCIHIGNKEIHVPIDTDPQVGLTFARIDNLLPFI